MRRKIFPREPKKLFGLDKKNYWRFALIPVYLVLSLFLLELLNNLYAFHLLKGFLLSGAVFFLLQAVFFLAIGRLAISVPIVSGLWTLLYVINFYRTLITGFALTPLDYYQLGGAGDIMGFVHLSIKASVVISVLGQAALTTFFCIFTRKIRLRFRWRMVSLAGCALCLFLILCSPLTALFLDKDANLPANELYRKDGVIAGFSMLTTNHFFSRNTLAGTSSAVEYDPKQTDPWGLTPGQVNGEYAAPFMNALVGGVQYRASNEPLPSPDPDVTKPNIIVLMSEAFTDPTDWLGVQFSSDPLPNYHSLIKDGGAYGGHVLSTEFGGGTCNPEFEFLTGNSLTFTKPGETPFLMPATYIPGPIDRSLPNQLRDQGYTTVGLHTNIGSFFNRSDNYPKLGFDLFLSLDNMQSPVIKGDYVSDDYWADQIIKQIGLATQPLFLYAISMENHYDYEPGKYNKTGYDIQLSSDKLDAEQTAVAMSYVQGIHDADAALGKIIAAVKNSGKPTIVLFFGDHHPLLMESSAVYRALGMIQVSNPAEWTLDQKFQLHETPYLIWSNYTLPVTPDWPVISPFFLGPALLEETGLQENLYYRFLSFAREQLGGFIPGLYVDTQGNYTAEAPAEDATVLRMFKMFEYDYIYGSKYTNALQAALLPRPAP